jgi:hypothetical protein
MFEKEIANYSFNIAKWHTGDRVSLSSLLTDVEIPDGFKKFAEGEIEMMLDEEGFTDRRSGRFKYSDSQVQSLFKEIRHVLKSSFEFSRDEFLDLTERASKFIFNYIIRPRWTLEKFLFKGETEIDRTSIERSTRFFNDYVYYLRGISEYLEFHKRNSIDVSTWRRLHTKIDEQLLGMLPSSLGNLVEPLFRLFRFASGSERVPTDALILFFKDKIQGEPVGQGAEIVDRLEFSKEVKNIETVSLSDLNAILSAPAKEIDQTIEVLPREEEPPKEFKTFSLDVEASDSKTPKEPIRTLPHVDQQSPLDSVEHVSESIPPTTQETVSKTEPLSTTLSGRVEPPIDRQFLSEDKEKEESKTRAPSIRAYLTPKQENKIIKKIFDGSKSSYHIAVHKLEECNDWKSASKIVEDIFIENDIDPFSKYAVVFTEAVSKRFSRL